MKEEYQEIESNYLLKKKSFENNKTKIDLLKKMNQNIESKMKYIGVLNSNQNALQGVVLNFDNGGHFNLGLDLIKLEILTIVCKTSFVVVAQTNSPATVFNFFSKLIPFLLF